MRTIYGWDQTMAPAHADADVYSLSAAHDRLRARGLPPARFSPVVSSDHALGLSPIPPLRQIPRQARRRRSGPGDAARAHGRERALLLYAEPDVPGPSDLSDRPHTDAPLLVRRRDHARDRDLVSPAGFGRRAKAGGAQGRSLAALHGCRQALDSGIVLKIFFGEILHFVQDDNE